MASTIGPGAIKTRPKSISPRNTLLLEAILESASQGIITTDPQGRILSVNSKTSEMFGYETDELIGQAVETLLPEAARSVHIRHRADYFSAPRARPMGVGLDLSARRKNGSEFPVEISLSYTQAGDEMLAIAFISDITERKRLEEQLVQSQKMEAVGRLAGGIAHDFNNLLTIIGGNTRLLLEGLSTFDPLRGNAEEVAKASERAAALTKKLLAFSRRQIAQPRIVNMNSIIRETEKMLRRLLGEDIHLIAILQPNLGNVKADPSQLEQVLFNLAINARDAMPGGGRITVETQNVELDGDYVKTHFGIEPGSFVMMAISDTGSGMDAETKRHIFEPFFTTKSVDKGTGLGLATVYGIVKQNRGDIWVYSEISKGTTFKVYLPRVQEDADQHVAQTSLDAEKGCETVLVVEDEAGVRQLIVSILRRSGYSVLEAADSLEAVQVSEKFAKEIQLLITDVIMPHSSGRELAQQLFISRPEIKVLYISGYTENTIVQHGILESDVEFLPKPFAFETLLAKVREVLLKK